jgi:hypothetical protein
VADQLKQKVFVLTFEYGDRSGFCVNGVTDNYDTAMAWFNANDETNVYAVFLNGVTTQWNKTTENWNKKS